MKKKCMETLRNTRREKNYSQEYMADKLGITQKAYSNIENGKTELKNDTLIKLAGVLELKPDCLCTLSNSCCREYKMKNNELKELLYKNNVEIPSHLL